MRSQGDSTPELSLIVPTYNESENIPPLLARVHEALSGYDYELIIVDDNSPDGTSGVAESLSSKYPVRVIVRTNERGLASAVVAGFAQARGRVVGVIDADLQHPPEMIPSLLEATRNGADVAIASRYIPGGGTEGWSRRRGIISRVAKLPAGVLLPSAKGIKDPLSGFFVFKKEVIEGAILTPTGYKILLEVLVKGKAGLVREVPYVFRERERGKSHFGVKEQVNYLVHLSRLAWLDGDVKRFLRFCVVGASGFFVNYGGYVFFTRVAGLADLAAIPVALEISIITNFILNDLWTFRDKRKPGSRATLLRLLKFNMVSGGATAIYYAIFYPLTRFLGISDLIAYPIAILVGLIWNFFMNFWWTWKVRAREEVQANSE